MKTRLLDKCQEIGLRMTDQRRIIAQVLSESTDHPDVNEVYLRASEIDSNISLATVYRTLRLFEEANILERHDFRDGRSRYEDASSEHHDHLINMQTGEIIEFHDEDIEALQRKIAERYGYDLIDHRLELYCVPLQKETTRDKNS
ncbi:Ferric uptake regulation protein [Candidatus Bealeia paramacronuclearis]|uniref:Ferric uptake regulation protein n=2 Tax=Candidatus Bealeia paramacronuclearis TaxID=1921001 RepID=A0ABZ2C566_9PROT|nr:Ferric uptake regulation protein [Candidatus Bealeia paramacronuclearis]